MAHTQREQKKILARISRLRGQVEALNRIATEGKDCELLLQTIAACRGAINGLMAEVLEGHIREHILDPTSDLSSEQKKATEIVIDLVKSYLK